jgi:hypothetical protein
MKEKKTVLSVMPVPEMGFAEYSYFVETPEGDVMYFAEKKKAKQFIDFYKSYTQQLKERKNEQVNHNSSL